MDSSKKTCMRWLALATVIMACSACGPEGREIGSTAPSGGLTGQTIQQLAADSLKQPIRFSSEPLPPFVKRTYGIGQAETMGRWTTGKLAVIELTGALPRSFDIELVAGAYGPNVGAKARLIIGAVVREFVVTGDIGAARSYTVSFDGVSAESMIFIEVPEPISPAALGKSDDSRKLGLALVAMAITPRQ